MTESEQGLCTIKGHLMCEDLNIIWTLVSTSNMSGLTPDKELTYKVDRAIVNYLLLLQPASTQCDVGPVYVPIEPQPTSTHFDVGRVCVPIELLPTYFNLPQPSVMLVECVSS